jgi:hypothetical protein
MDKHTIFLLFYGGFVATFACLLLATFIRHSNGARIVCFIVAFCGLIYEGGCFATANGVGKAFGGGDDREMQIIFGYIELAFVVAVLWIILLVVFLPVKKPDQQRGKNEGSRDDWHH